MRSSHRTSRSMAAEVRRGTRVLLGPGFYAPSTLSAREIFVARIVAAATTREATVSHRAAAALWGIPVVPEDLRVVEFTRDGHAGRPLREGIMVHGLPLPAEDRRCLSYPGLGTISVTSPTRTCLDLAASMGFEAGVIALEHLLFRGVAKAEIDACLTRMGRRVGRAVMDTALDFAGSSSESAGESLSRLRFREWPGFPQPQQQVRVQLRSGLVVRTDFRWQGSAGRVLIGEFDGIVKYGDTYAASSADALIAEKRRHDALTNEGYVVVRWGWTEVFAEPEQLRATLCDGLQRAGIAVPRSR